ncbi:Imm7 family immunity protein [Streptomyces sp. NPDC013953]|uniref:Imm7 family immunity protein n=1 Tax=Streptomyces sp. NPDC013953 TaxID=3364868 RepID=UPI0036FF914D
MTHLYLQSSAAPRLRPRRIGPSVGLRAAARTGRQRPRATARSQVTDTSAQVVRRQLPSPLVARCRRTVRACGRGAPGGHGLLHVRDDEEPGHENEVRVLRLDRGAVTWHTEVLLSPCIPTVEDPSVVRGSPAHPAAGAGRRSRAGGGPINRMHGRARHG